jgi:putative acetyltransferase
VASHELTIRFEQEGDGPAIRDVNQAAFGTPGEADLVDELRHWRASVVSLVAEDGGSIVGHILFSPVTAAGGPVQILGLAPMAVRTERQRRGVGSQLVRAGLAAARERGAEAIVVVGHARFYPRFGFVPASRFGLRCEYDVADDVFMALELVQGVLAGKAGLVRYHPAFAAL